MAGVTKDQQNDGMHDAGAGVAAGLAGTAGALAIFGGSGTVAGLATGVGPPLAYAGWKLVQRAQAAREARMRDAMEYAAVVLGGLHILDERTANDEARAELLARVLVAAGRSTMRKKVRALAWVLVDGVQEDGSIDEAFALAAALDDLEAVHVLILKHMADIPVPPLDLRREKDEGVKPGGWETSEVARALAAYAMLAEQAMGVLERHGLVDGGGGVLYPGIVGPPIYRVAPLGVRCLFLLHDEGVQRER